MEGFPVTFTAQGMPARLGNNFVAGGTSCVVTVPAPTERWVYLVTGIDASCSVTGLTGDFWLKVNAGGNVYFGSWVADPTSPTPHYHASWRGALPVGQTMTLDAGASCIAPASLSVVVWGLVVPYPMGVAI